MSGPTLEELVAQELKKDPVKDAPAAPTTATRLAAPRATSTELKTEEASFLDWFKLVNPGTMAETMFRKTWRAGDDGKIDRIEAFQLGVADTVSFGFMDEVKAGTAWLISDASYVDELRKARQVADAAEENYSGTYLTGQIVGGFVPVAGMGGRAKAAVDTVKAGRATGMGRMVAESGAQGALYGFGSADTDGLFDYERFRDSAVYGMYGVGAGFLMGGLIFPAGRMAYDKGAALIRRGPAPKIDFKFKANARPTAADDVAEDLTDLRLKNAKTPSAPRSTPEATAPAPKKTNAVTGVADDVAEDGALFSAKEMGEVTAESRDILMDRISKLTPQQARSMARKFDKARATGKLGDDPQFRSLLGILDLDTVTDDVAAATDAAEFLEEIGKALRDRSGMGRKRVDAMERDLKAKFGGSLSESELDAMVAKVQESSGSANVGSSVMALAGIRFAKATKELMPKVMAKEEGSRELLAEELSKAIRISAKGQYLVSEAGRNLGMLSHKRNLAFAEVVEGEMKLETAEAVQARVKAAMDRLSDDELNELIARVDDLSDLSQVQEILGNPEAAEQVSNWIRARNSIGLFVKSNSLTPMSGVVNTVGFIMHDIFRNTWAREIAAMASRRAGNVDEALVIEMQKQVAKAVRWQAHGAGINAALQRMKWEWLDSVEKVAGVAGFKNRALKASASRQAMIANGFSPPPLREFDRMQRAAVTDISGFNQKLADRAEAGGSFATLVNALERTGATALNTVDALGTATARVVTGVLDDWGRNYVKVREVYAEAAAHATKEALDGGLNEKQLVEYVSRRTGELADIPPMDILSRVEQKLVDDVPLDDTDRMLLRRDWKADREAEAVLFMDGPQTAGGRWAAQGASYADKLAGLGAIPGILFTYIRTPIRIFERGLASYTPWAGKIAETQAILARGGVEAAVERARMDLGAMVMGVGMMAAATGVFSVTNGGYKNSKNLTGAPPNRLELPGGAYVELSRLDPFSLTLALGGIIGQAWHEGQMADDRYGHDDAMATAMATAFVGVREAILEKSFLTGARDLSKALFAPSEDSAAKTWADMATDALTRAIPFSGTSRQLNETLGGDTMEAVGIIDKLMKVTPGLGTYLPARIDPLGNEVENRVMGLAAGTTSDIDPVTRQLADLGIDITSLRKADPQGFDLNSEELSEIRRIRGTEAVNKDGLTMKEALANLFEDPAFQALPSRDQVRDAVVETMSEFNEDARLIFESRNQQYLADREANRSFKDYIASGIAADQAERYAEEDVQQMGLPAPERINKY